MSQAERKHTRVLNDRYILLDKIHGRKRAHIYVARDISDSHLVVAKIYSDGVPKQLIEEEVTIQASLQHPHILPLEDFSAAGTPPYLIFELAPGGSLKSAIGHLSPQSGIEGVIQIADGLSYAHQTVLHRDIKPSNVLITPTGLKIADWESAVPIDQTSMTEKNKMIGTFDYAAPEFIRNPDLASPASDLYSLGKTSYELLTGSRPYSRDAIAVHLQAGYFPPPRTFESVLGKRFVTVFHDYAEAPIRKALSYESERRQESVEEFGEEMRQGYANAMIIYAKRRTIIDLRQGEPRIGKHRQRKFWRK